MASHYNIDWTATLKGYYLKPIAKEAGIAKKTIYNYCQNPNGKKRKSVETLLMRTCYDHGIELIFKS